MTDPIDKDPETKWAPPVTWGSDCLKSRCPSCGEWMVSRPTFEGSEEARSCWLARATCRSCGEVVSYEIEVRPRGATGRTQRP
jgi:hypothetical protein